MSEQPEGRYVSPDEIKRGLIDRAQWYAKGFGALLSGLGLRLYLLSDGKISEDNIGKIQAAARELVDLYEAVPVDDLKESPDHDLLSEIKRQVNELNGEINKILSGEKNIKESVYAELIQEIGKNGREFMHRLEDLLNGVREYPGYENFVFSSTDVHGKLWRDVFKGGK